MNFSTIERCETHSHSHYSNIRGIDSINRPMDMIMTAARLGLKGIILTDHEALCGHVEWLKAEKELKEKEKIPSYFKCGLGNEIYLTDDRSRGQKYYHFILIAKDTIGHRALRELSSIAWYNLYVDRGVERVPTLKSDLSEIMSKYKGHIIATTACIGGQLANIVFELNEATKNNNQEEINNCKRRIVEFLKYCVGIFGDDFYIEVAPSKSPDQIKFNKLVKPIAHTLGIKMILATDAHYLGEKDRYVHKSYLNSKDTDREVDAFYSYSYLMSNEEAFSNLYPYFTEEEFAILCTNTMDIYNKIGTYELFHNPIIPKVEVSDYPKIDIILPFEFKGQNNYPILRKLLSSDSVQERYWVNQCIDGLKEKHLFNKQYMDRLEIEADVITEVGNKLGNCLFEYFNTFQHFIDLFWECGSLSGPGRGSSVCFLSNYLLGITQLDPIEWDLMYWRFLNKERIELPDIDTDLSPSKRKLIFKKMRQERGELNVIQVSTFGTETSRSATQTACRGYRSEFYPDGIDVDTAAYLSSLIPVERGFVWSLSDVVYGDEAKDRKPIRTFIEEVNKYPGLLDIMLSIEGLISLRSIHASGVMLYNGDVYETNAIMRSSGGELVTQFSLHDSESLGDTKFDFLVTEVCDKLSNAINLLKEDEYFEGYDTLRAIYEEYFHPSKINLSDTRIWDALAAGTVIDVFQFNSSVGLQAAKAIKPRDPWQMTAANALLRLMAQDGYERPMDRYCRMKADISQWYIEMDKAGITKEEQKMLEKYYLKMYATPPSQEDLMLVCMEPQLGNFSLKEANAARKIVAKKKMKEIPTLKEKFVSQCPNRNIGEYVWDTVMGPQMG